MEKIELKEMIDKKMSIREIAKEVGKSPTSIRYWLTKFSFKTKINLYNKGAIGKGYLCQECGETDPIGFYKPRSRCKNCHNESQKQKVKELKERAVIYKGGACQLCGYFRNLTALDFHHRDPKGKDPNWITSRHWSFERLKKELDKCDLVCRNCHAEIHHPNHFRDVG